MLGIKNASEFILCPANPIAKVVWFWGCGLKKLRGISEFMITGRSSIKRLAYHCWLPCTSIIFRAAGKQTVHLLHIGKTGGTALKEALREASGKKYRLIMHRHTTTLRYISRRDKVIFFVRDPISRFVSGFYSRQRRGMPRYNAPWSKEEAEAFAHFSTPNQLALSLSSPDPAIKEAALKAMQTIRHVNTHYRYWLISKDYLLSRRKSILFIGTQEDLEADFEMIKRLLGLPHYVRLPNDPFKAHRNPANVDKPLDPEAIGNLNQWYAEDYELYELCLKLREQIIHVIRVADKK